jgi:hypothetical protein
MASATSTLLDTIKNGYKYTVHKHKSIETTAPDDGAISYSISLLEDVRQKEDLQFPLVVEHLATYDRYECLQLVVLKPTDLRQLTVLYHAIGQKHTPETIPHQEYTPKTIPHQEYTTATVVGPLGTYKRFGSWKYNRNLSSFRENITGMSRSAFCTKIDSDLDLVEFPNIIQNVKR